MQKDSNRPRRVAELIKRELAGIIAREWNEPQARKITLTAAEVARDLSSARIYFTVLGGGEAIKAAGAALNRAAGFLRHALTQRLALRTVPQLRFYHDKSVEDGARLASLIERAVADDKAGHRD